LSVCSNVTIKHQCAGKIAILLQAFGLGVGLLGLKNVLQCGLGLYEHDIYQACPIQQNRFTPNWN
tara:strand:+ start:37971 stop:38165 length:195 start_codon:yes stop_codon:yes gene_type:complete